MISPRVDLNSGSGRPSDQPSPYLRVRTRIVASFSEAADTKNLLEIQIWKIDEWAHNAPYFIVISILTSTYMVVSP